MASCRSVFFIFVLFCISILSETNSDPLQIHERIEERKPNSRAVVNLKGGPDSVIWVVQLSDLHFSVFHPDRALDFKRLVAPALAMINPALVLITGDLTDGKSKDLLIMKQDENEWIEYQKVMEDVIGRSGLDKNIFYDLRGNHDNFGVPKVGGSFDFFSKYSINGRLRRYGNVHSVTIKNGQWKHLFVGFDNTMSIGLRGPTNLFGHPTDQLLADIDIELSQWNSELTKQLTKISFGHFPLSFSASTDSSKSLKDVFFKHSLSAYLCGHLHTRFGKNLKRHHLPDDHFLSSEKYFQLNIHQTPRGTNVNHLNCSIGAPPVEEFWEWEMGDWRKSRAMRVLAIDAGHVSFIDIDFKLGAKKTIILPTFPLDSRFMLTASYHQEYGCHSMDPSSYETIRALVFSVLPIVSVVARIYDSKPGYLQMIMEASMRKNEENSTRGDLYIIPWNWRAFEDLSPDRFWLQIEATDATGRSTLSELRPFSVNGLSAKLNWKWKEFLVMGCQWAALYYPILWSAFLFIFSMLLILTVLFFCSKNQYTNKNLSLNKGFLTCMLLFLTESHKVLQVCFGMLAYLFYLIFFPWCFGKVFTEGQVREYMTYKGWVVNISNESDKRVYVGYPDVMVVVLPHLVFVVLPAILVIGVLAAERGAFRVHYLLLSGKKEDDYDQKNKKSSMYVHKENKRLKLFLGGRWIRKLLLVVCLIIYWKHWRHCEALMKAYEMNPFLHFPVYCFSIPFLLGYAIYKTMES
ncbi:PREDICTED: putative metallophosphoesterase At3g03305 [Nelumbo nucifera]|uniref:Metallophosphoesterase At3g03305 n=2 Tax=Nelumbo nucifera TaxID=4432 RepID=A0A1U8ALC5_NELNU|nr:PREDICTED: putative metallophosphoesterase At3g03305 [Nelumbo nucifera]XP_010268142.1 PREDICTED: putative metallophosphoesterase At3g03305 [Nelumbo nucifera]XP_010268143.1 PREDICTED: putative metallophosphoesterase At3g03305 [Nelumbo nucifera]DAD25256.1 TPA_asm: hypothetical protein HUJ06_026720 [Nelumbo nucifera]